METAICDACGDEIDERGVAVSSGPNLGVMVGVRLGDETDPLRLVLCQWCARDLIGDFGQREFTVEEAGSSE